MKLKIEELKPTEKMIEVLKNLKKYNYVTDREYNKALKSYTVCSEYIEKYQGSMHKSITYMTEEECDELGLDSSMFT